MTTKKTKLPKQTSQKRLNISFYKVYENNKFNTRLTLLLMRKGSTTLIKNSDADSQAVRMMSSRLKKLNLGLWKPSTLNVPSGILVKRIL